LNPFSRTYTGKEVDERKPVNKIVPQQLSFHLKIAEPYVDMLNDLPEFRGLTTDELFKMIPSAALRKAIPLVGDDHTIREAAYEREIRMRRAVIIGILAQPEQIQQYLSQRFVERL
jgi:hypothetical protein